MSLETRSNSALFKRAEQLKRWEESDTNQQPAAPRRRSTRVKFSSGCVFLAACAAADKDEVDRLLEQGADIDTANVDGLTALHQACIDDNLDMVEFLVSRGADVNRGDNEGWTPLHATASCGHVAVAELLLTRGADPAAVNGDGDLPLDLAECRKISEMLRKEVERRGIDCDAARHNEETAMLRDAKEWLAQKSPNVNVANPKTGATPLHVAAAKGYDDVIKILLQCGADVDAQDVDGWTPMHAAAHWRQKGSCQLLADNLADMDAKNYVGQTPFDLCDGDMLPFLDDLKMKQNKDDLNKRKAKKRVEIQDNVETETPPKIPKKVEVEITESKADENIEKKNMVNSLTINEVAQKEVETAKLPPVVPPKQIVENTEENAPWRKPPARPTKSELSSPVKSAVSFRDFKNNSSELNENEVTLRRTNSFQSDEEFYRRYKALHARIKAYQDSAVIPYRSQNNNNNRPQSDIILTSNRGAQHFFSSSKDEKNESSVTSSNAPSSPSKTTSPLQSPQTNNQQQPLRRSFVPPVRDEESETQRKAHAKRVRETRRSTQGVTLEEIKSAEQFVKMKNQPTSNSSDTHAANNGETATTQAPAVSVTATITTAAPTIVTRDTSNNSEDNQGSTLHERRPSWRLKVDGGSKFKLEDATKPPESTQSSVSPQLPGTPSFVRRSAATNGASQNNNHNQQQPRPASAPPADSSGTEAAMTVTLPLRRPKSVEEKEQDKENDARNAQATLATQAAIQRRRRPKRRSTGVVNFDNLEDMDQEKDPAAGGDNNSDNVESGADRSSRSRINSTADIRNENGEIDYKKLYEQQLAENERLKDKLRKSEEELRETKQTLERLNVVTSKNSLSELEKREKRAMERKLSEMEEELKNLENLKSENQRLKEENGALIRVISKLSK